MSRLPLVDPAQAQGKTHELFNAVKAKMGKVPNMTRVMANSPAVLEGYLGFSAALGGGELDPKLRERIALGVGESNGCGYCLAAHNLLGKLAGLEDDDRLESRGGHSRDPKADAALKFSRALLEKRGHVSESEIAEVKAAGFSDAEVAEIIGHVALNVLTNYFNIAVETPIDFPAAPPLAS